MYEQYINLSKSNSNSKKDSHKIEIEKTLLHDINSFNYSKPIKQSKTFLSMKNCEELMQNRENDFSNFDRNYIRNSSNERLNQNLNLENLNINQNQVNYQLGRNFSENSDYEFIIKKIEDSFVFSYRQLDSLLKEKITDNEMFLRIMETSKSQLIDQKGLVYLSSLNEEDLNSLTLTYLHVLISHM